MPHHYQQVRSSTTAVRRWREDEEVPSRGKLFLLCLTICLGGLQVVWATVMAQGSSYLISLDLRPSVVSLVWLAGPICGTLLQPYIAYKSDYCTHKWGRRRPFMIYGTIATIACINALSWTSEAVRLICNLLGVSDHGFGAKFVIQVFAVTGVWLLNVAIQPVQASIRALIVDACPGSQAAKANSFASIAVIIGSAIGYGCAFIEMPKGPAWLTNPQFKGLCFIASISLGVTVTITSVMIEEKAVNIDNDGSEKSGLRKIWIEIYGAIRTLPPTIKMIMEVQFCAWLAWFPFLFNIVLFLSRLYEVQTLSEKMGPPSTKFYNGLRQQSIRHATLAMLVFSMVALVTNLCLPYLIIDADSSSNSELEWQKEERLTSAKPGIFVLLRKRLVNRLTLPRVWMISHIIMAFALFGITFGGDGFMTSVLFVSLLGFSWTLTQWAPFAMIAAEIASSSIPDLRSLETDTEDQSASLESVADLRPRAGITMAIHNIAIATPQMLSAIVGALIYWIHVPHVPILNVRFWAFLSEENNGSDEKLLTSTTSSSVASIDEEDSSSTEKETRQQTHHRIFFISSILAIVVLGAVTLTTLLVDSHSGVVPNTPSPPSQGGSQVVAHCGISAQEAMERGCLWDIMSFGWIHPLCFDKEESDRWAAKYGPFDWYVDDGQAVDEKEQPVNGTLTQPLSLDEIPFAQSVWTTQGYHIMHCLYLLKMVHVAALNSDPVSNEAVNLGHTDHCVGLIGNTDLIEYDAITTPVRLLFVQCVTLQ
ncbi:hypothetical protein BELL_0318g00010 [Botrytis elliptica]|uniref:Major facilitator superfamily (MFS) profile domain-containing protein n=1 Tax=Botrytis elliptica TaxID=278938 RepID=A0A4Z1JKG1_9HELO|nr:hypothetical protein BELL_0318g00010 [Botrytis elliptica]